jgi:TRAP transporter TAXI family solute receptor
MTLAGRLALLLLLTAFGLTSPMEFSHSLRAEEIRYIRIGTGPIGGTYFPVGGLIANVISGPPGSMACDLGGSCGVPGLIAAAVSTQGSIDNVKEMASGMVDLALCQANIARDAYTGNGLYAGKPVETLRVIANLFPEAVHVVVREDGGSKSIDELKGKRVSVGEENSGTLATAKIVLRGYNLALKDLKLVYEKLARSADMLTAGEIDAFFVVGGQPVAAIAHSAERTPIALLPITGRAAERIIAVEPFFSPTLIPGDAYSGVPATETIGVGAQLLASADMDADLVYAITRSLWDPRNRKVLDGGTPNGRWIRLASALDRLAGPLHPGARRFYLKAGMMQAGQL